MALFAKPHAHFARDEYVLLLSGLPRLPVQLTRKPLPISPTRLQTRLGLLVPQHQALWQQINQAVAWPQVTKELSDQSLLIPWDSLLHRLQGSALEKICRDILDLRTVIAALQYRLKSAGQPPDNRWSSSHLLPIIQRHWLQPDMGLRIALPWLIQVRELIEKCQPLAVQQWLLQHQLKRLVRHSAYSDFSFESVVIYALHWQLLFAWGESVAPSALARVEHLLAETFACYQGSTSGSTSPADQIGQRENTQ